MPQHVVKAKRDWTGGFKKITRDTVLFTTGLFLTINEAVWKEGDADSVLVLLFAGMMGLPVVLRADEFRAKATAGGTEGSDA